MEEQTWRRQGGRAKHDHCPSRQLDFCFQPSGISTPQLLTGRHRPKGEKKLFLTQLKLASGAWPPSSVLPPSYRQTDWGAEGAHRPVWSRVQGAELRLVAQHQTGNSSQGLDPESLSEQLYPGDPMGSVLPKMQESQRGDPAGAHSPTNRSH